MSKKYGNLVFYKRNGVDIQALVALSRQVFVDGAAVEHLTVIYLDPTSESIAPTGEQLRNSIKVQNDVAPLVEGSPNGWSDYAEPKADADRIEGSPREVVEAVQFGAASEEIARLRKELADTIEKYVALQAKVEAAASETITVGPGGAPSHVNPEGGELGQGEPIVTGEGKTQAQLDAEIEQQKAERTPEEKALEPTNGDPLSPENVERPIEVVMGVPEVSPAA